MKKTFQKKTPQFFSNFPKFFLATTLAISTLGLPTLAQNFSQMLLQNTNNFSSGISQKISQLSATEILQIRATLPTQNSKISKISQISQTPSILQTFSENSLPKNPQNSQENPSDKNSEKKSEKNSEKIPNKISDEIFSNTTSPETPQKSEKKSRVYPIKNISRTRCRPEIHDSCTFPLPRITDAKFREFQFAPRVRASYSVLRGASYTQPRTIGAGSHGGVDFATSVGTPVHATADGTVIRAERAGQRGNVVVIEHDTPRGKIRSSYAHLSTIFVKSGDKIRQNETLGLVGDTGNSSGPHLHFQLDTHTGDIIPRFPRCAGSVDQIVNEARCQNQVRANTLDPILFLETDGASRTPDARTTISPKKFENLKISLELPRVIATDERIDFALDAGRPVTLDGQISLTDSSKNSQISLVPDRLTFNGNSRRRGLLRVSEPGIFLFQITLGDSTIVQPVLARDPSTLDTLPLAKITTLLDQITQNF